MQPGSFLLTSFFLHSAFSRYCATVPNFVISTFGVTDLIINVRAVAMGLYCFRLSFYSLFIHDNSWTAGLKLMKFCMYIFLDNCTKPREFQGQGHSIGFSDFSPLRDRAKKLVYIITLCTLFCRESARIQFRLPDASTVVHVFPSSETLSVTRDFIITVCSHVCSRALWHV